MQQIGQFILYAVFATTVVAALVAMVGAQFRNVELMRSARFGLYAVTFLNLAMSAVMMHSLLTHDFGNMYIATYTDVDMPTAYVMAAFWGGEKGALLFWVTVLSIFSTIAIYQNRHKEPVYMAWTTGILLLALLFFDVLMVFESSPFEAFLTFAGPEDGQGMNPLLQNPTMTIHPPALLTGFIAFTLPFAFGLAALIRGKLDDEWAKDTRKWTIVCWIFLTTGLILGGFWAYEELGWGGYWMWDPVENAGLIPWFTATAFLHSVMIQERRQMLKRWNFFLVLLTFVLTIFGTFLTRSQLIDSIHAFADSKLSLYFLWYMIIIAAVSAIALAVRWREMKPEARVDHFLSRESFFVLNNILLLGSAFVVMWGTLFSKVSETQAVQGAYNTVAGVYNATLGHLLGPMEMLTQAVVLGEPWFNRVMIPIGILLLLLTGLGPVISWRKATRKNFQTNLRIPIMVSTLVTTAAAVAWGIHRVIELRHEAFAQGYAQWLDEVTAWTGKVLVLGAGAGDMPSHPFATWGSAYGQWADSLGQADVYVFLAFLFSALVVATVFIEFYRGTKVRQRKQGGAFVLNLFLLTLRTPRRYGGYIIHLGVVLAFVAFSGGAFRSEVPEQPLYPGDRIELTNYHLTFARQDDVWHQDGAYVASKATLVVLEGRETVPTGQVAAIEAQLEKLGLAPFHIETFPGDPAVRLQFVNPEHRAAVSESIFVHSFLNDTFELVEAPAGKPTLGYRMRQLGALQVMPRLVMKHAQAVREFFADHPGNIAARFVPGSPLMTLTFGSVAARDGFLERAEGPGIFPEMLVGWFDPETQAIEVIPTGVGSVMTPEVRFYQKHGTPTTEVAIQSKLHEDLYLAMRPSMGQPFINLLAVVFPLVSFLWAGTLIMIIGGLICLLPKSVSGLARGGGGGGGGGAESAAGIALLVVAGLLFAPRSAMAQEQGRLQSESEDHGDEIPLADLPADGINDFQGAQERLFEALRCPDRQPGGLVIRDEPLGTCPTGSAEELRAALVNEMGRYRTLPPREAMHKVLESWLLRDPANERLLRFPDSDFHALYGGIVCTCGCTNGMSLDNCPLSCGNSKSWKTRFKVLLAEGYSRDQARAIYLTSTNAALAPDQKPFSIDDIDADPQKSLTWALPAIIIGGAATTFVVVMTGMRKRRQKAAASGSASAAPGSTLSESERRLLQDELEDLD